MLEVEAAQWLGWEDGRVSGATALCRSLPFRRSARGHGLLRRRQSAVCRRITGPNLGECGVEDDV